MTLFLLLTGKITFKAKIRVKFAQGAGARGAAGQCDAENVLATRALAGPEYPELSMRDIRRSFLIG